MDTYIKTFAFIDSLCEYLGTRAYLWGGWIADVYSGKILREHDDAEHLVVNLYTYRGIIKSVFDSLEWETEILINDDLKVKKGGLKIHFGHLEVRAGKAEWLHNGKLGKIIFPTNWLNNKELCFQNATFHAVKPEFQYVLKLHPEFMNPEWKHRKKDIEDIKVLKKILKGKLSDLETKMKSI